VLISWLTGVESVSPWEPHPRYGTRCKRFHSFVTYLHTYAFSRERYEPWLCLLSSSWSSFTDPEGMEGWVTYCWLVTYRPKTVTHPSTYGAWRTWDVLQRDPRCGSKTRSNTAAIFWTLRCVNKPNFSKIGFGECSVKLVQSGKFFSGCPSGKGVNSNWGQCFS